MVGDCNVFLLAGFDTTTTSVHSMIYNLGLKPDLQAKLRKEIRTLRLNERDTTLETLDTGVLLEKIVRETIRVHPPVALVFNREIMTDFKLGPYNIRKGDGVNFMIAPMLWDQEVFESGFEFNEETINEANKRNWLPFSLGKRACLGQLLSQMELKVFASYIIDNFELRTMTDPKDVKFTISLTMKLSPCEVAFHPISKSE